MQHSCSAGAVLAQYRCSTSAAPIKYQRMTSALTVQYHRCACACFAVVCYQCSTSAATVPHQVSTNVASGPSQDSTSRIALAQCHDYRPRGARCGRRVLPPISGADPHLGAMFVRLWFPSEYGSCWLSITRRFSLFGPRFGSGALPEVLRLLLAAHPEAAAEAHPSEGWTPLHYAERLDVESVKLLLEKCPGAAALEDRCQILCRIGGRSS